MDVHEKYVYGASRHIIHPKRKIELSIKILYFESRHAKAMTYIINVVNTWFIIFSYCKNIDINLEASV